MQVRCNILGSWLILFLLTQSLGAVLPLREQWAAAVSAFRNGQQEQAAAHFATFVHWYDREPSVATTEFQEPYLRLRALNAIAVGDLQQALALLHNWLDAFPEHPHYRSFLRFQLAACYRALGNMPATWQQWGIFLQEFPDIPEALLVRWQWAESALGENDWATAEQLLNAVLDSDSLHRNATVLAVSALALLQMAQGNDARAAQLLNHPAFDNRDALSQLSRGLLAPALVAGFLRQDELELAQQCQHWFSWTAARMHQWQNLHANLAQQRATAAGQHQRARIWNAHWQTQVDRLSLLETAVEVDRNEMSLLYELRLQVLLKSELFPEAATLAQALIDPRVAMEASLRASAWQSGIRAWQQLREFDLAEQWVEQFISAFPDDPAIGDILFLNARTSAMAGRIPSAIAQMELLCARFPDDRAQNQWRLQLIDWLRTDGRSNAALSMLKDLEQTAPAAWQGFLRLQQALCLRDLRQSEAAVALLTEIVSTKNYDSELCGEALLELLKLLLTLNQPEAFQKTWANIPPAIHAGRHSPNLQLIHALFQERIRQTRPAIEIYRKLSAPEFGQFRIIALQNRSRLYRESGDTESLRQLATLWIQEDLRHKINLAAQAFADLHYQPKRSNRPIGLLCHATRRQLLDALSRDCDTIPVMAMLDWLATAWPAIHNQWPDEVAGADSFEQWRDTTSLTLKNSRSWRSYTGLRIHNATALHAAQRFDSADSVYLNLLQTLPSLPNDDYAVGKLALVALAYDYPNAESLLHQFLQLYPDSSLRPAALLALANHYASDRNWSAAIQATNEIFLRWRDATEYPQALLQTAQWHLKATAPTAAIHLLDQLFQLNGLPPELLAGALLLKGNCQLDLQDLPAFAITQQRLAILFPSFPQLTTPDALVAPDIPSTSTVPHDD